MTCFYKKWHEMLGKDVGLKKVVMEIGSILWWLWPLLVIAWHDFTRWWMCERLRTEVVSAKTERWQDVLVIVWIKHI